MPKIPDCDRCLLYGHNPYFVCAVHPQGVDIDECPDFRENPNAEPLELWEPEGASYYNGELILQPDRLLTTEQQLELLDTHPIFTGVCPKCNYFFTPDSTRIHWDCPDCSWMDDSI
ncbi:MAG TPA: hypothetical protein VK184_03565 [Nostocaceae cyanobacterium]|nr:hypothetical protein [Nostocaceae cyanobacterium]